MNYYKTIGVLLMLVMICPLYSQETAVSSEASSSPSKIKLSLPEVVRNVVERNLEVQKASIEYNDADTDLSKFDGQYDTYIYGRAGKQYKQLSEENPSLSKNGYRTDVNNYEAGIQKRLITGTTISANVSLTDQTVTPMPGVASFSGYSSSVNIGLSQELLKNAFGLDERLAKKTLENVTEIKKRAARQMVADAVMDSFVVYWNYIIAEENLKTAQIAYKNTGDIRNLIRRKISFGLSERQDIYDWEGRVLLAQNGQEGATLGFMNARLALLRALNIDRNAEIETERDFVSLPPDTPVEVSIQEAFKKRTDLANLHAAIEIAEMKLRIAKGDSLPSLTLSGGIGYNDYNPDSVSGSFNTINKQWNVGIAASKALGNTANDADIKNAQNDLQKRKIELKQLEDGIRDEITVRTAQCETAYKIYNQTTKSSEFAKSYYLQIMNKFSQGRLETTQLKLAFDNYISLRNSALKTLVDYNVALLELEIAKNTVFEKYSIDVNRIIGLADTQQ